jgi:hypothetical protein
MRTITLNMIDRSRYDENEAGQPIEETVPCDIQPEAIRCYYQRKGGRTGTRLTFTDGRGFCVKETFDEVRAAIKRANSGSRRAA